MSSLADKVGQVGGVVAAADLSAKRYYFVKRTSTTEVNLCGAGEIAMGVLCNKPELGDVADVQCIAYGRVEAGGTFAIGDPLKSDAAGKAVKADTDKDHICGWADSAGSSGAKAKLFIVPGSLSV
jgi:hypothetical protein